MSRKLSLIVCLLLISRLGPAGTAATHDEDAVLSIWATKAEAGASHVIGSGFLISQDGQFLTCYHVVRGAQKLTVFHGKAGYDNIQLIAIAPEYDLALLQVVNFPGQGPFLRLSTDPPSQYFDEKLKVHGSPNGLVGQQLDATTTARNYMLSGQFRSPDGGDRIFNLQNVELIPLQMTIYRGLSGGPVVSKGGVVGVISGSFTQGGSIAWAIPTMYASLSKMTPMHRPFLQMTTWPELSLMVNDSKAWNTLQYGVSLTAGLSWALDSYLSGLEEYSQSAKGTLVDSLDELARLLEKTISELDAIRAGTKTSAEAERRMSEYTVEMAATARTISDRELHLREEQGVLLDRFKRLVSETRDFQSALPQTPKNQARIARAENDSATVLASLMRGGLAIMSSSLAFRGKLLQVESDLKKAQSVRDVRKVLASEQKTIEAASKSNATQLTSIVTSYREIGDIAKSLLGSE